MAKQATRATILGDYKHMGKEPAFTGDEVLTETQLIRNYSWYSHFCGMEESKQYLKEFCAANKLAVNTNVHDNMTYGWVARMLTRGAKLPDNVLVKFKDYLKKIAKKKDIVKEVTNDNVEQVSKPTDRSGQFIADIEEAIDNFPSEFSTYKYLTSNTVPQIYAKKIIERYIPLKEELDDAYAKKDKDLVEGYAHMKRTELKSLVAFVTQIISDCEQYLGNTKKQRKPRKKKVKTAETYLKNFRYLKEDVNLKIASDDPAKIIGASSVITFNTKNNVLTLFVASTEAGLSINRTAIAGYDEAKSKSKKIGRKTAEIIKMVTDGTKRSRLKIMDSIRTDYCKFTDRLNETTIILKADK